MIINLDMISISGVKFCDLMSCNPNIKKLSSYSPIYCPSFIELDSRKRYIETYLKTRFIHLCKAHVGAFIPFDKKQDRKFRRCIN